MTALCRWLWATTASVVLLSAPGLPAGAQTRRPMTLVDLLNIPRISDPQISPDGKSLTFVLATADWTANQRVPRIWRISTDGTGLRQLVDDADRQAVGGIGADVAILNIEILPLQIGGEASP